jgi:hypothetical protein
MEKMQIFVAIDVVAASPAAAAGHYGRKNAGAAV